mgnify:CR=1 FL=1
MREDLLQFIWKFKYFNLNELTSFNGEPIEIIHPGTHNFDQGPDFLNARIKISGTLWIGNVELHVFSRQWVLHKHQLDRNYSNVILHVVWKHDGEVENLNGNVLPTLELEGRVAGTLLEKYQSLMEREQKGELHFIPCENHLAKMKIEDIKLSAWKNRLVAERLEARTARVFEILEQTKFHWDETMWRMVAANFGVNINGQFSYRIAESVSQKILARHKNQLITIEAMLFGQASLLNESFTDPYPKLLQREYRFYNNKYNFPRVDGSALFGRMRPANFPTIRLAQLASLVFKSSHLFSRIKDFESVKDVKNALQVEPNDFWLYHYKLNEPDGDQEPKKKTLGNQMIENIIINSVCTILFAYGIYNNDDTIKEKSIDWLEALKPEKNKITRGFESLGILNNNAFDSQGLIHLKKAYCDKKRCLECAIGNLILGTS